MTNRSLPLFLSTLLVLGMVNMLPAAEPLRVMSFNIRYGSAKDGPNAWDNRKEFLVETIRKFHPDLLGTQETEAGQRDYLQSQLTDYEAWGVGRDDGKEKGEMMALFYRRSRFSRLDGGHFWLSETPDVAGSKNWDSAHPRMVSWVKLKDAQGPEPGPIYFFNTHLDHMSQTARDRGAQLLHDKIRQIAGQSPAIVTGDFNSKPGSMPYQNLFTPGEQPPLLVDVFRVVHPEPQGYEGTFSSFKTDKTDASRIDWIGCTAQLEPATIEINRVQRDGRFPSDHFPLEAILKYRAK